MWRRIRYLLMLAGLCAIATCPSAHRSCRAKVRVEEARVLEDAITAEVRRLVAAGAPLPKVAAPPTPPVAACCEQGGRCAVAPELWAKEPWRSLRFSMDRPHRYSVEYEPVAGGAVVRIIGDVDCDGVLGSHQLRFAVSGKDVAVTREVTNALE